MLQTVQYGIAMGNAKGTVKNAADDITDSHDNNGICKGFKNTNCFNLTVDP